MPGGEAKINDYWLYDPGGGSDLEYIHFARQKLYLQAGDEIEVPIILRSYQSLGGVSFSLRYKKELYSDVQLRVAASVSPHIDTDTWSGWTVNYENRVAATCLFEHQARELNGASLRTDLVLGTVYLKIAPDAPESTHTFLVFEDMPNPDLEQEAWITNEVSDLSGDANSLRNSAAPLEIEIVPAPVFVRGEVNGDGALDPADPIFMLMYLFSDGQLPDCPDAADTNDDGTLDLSDVIWMLDYLWGNGAPPMAPYPQVGTDLSVDSLPPCQTRPFGLRVPDYDL